MSIDTRASGIGNYMDNIDWGVHNCYKILYKTILRIFLDIVYNNAKLRFRLGFRASYMKNLRRDL